MKYSCIGPGVLAVLLSSGCATTQTGFTETEFVGKSSGYRISYAEPSKWLVVPDDWELDNYFVDRNVKPDREKDQGVYRESMTWVEESGKTSNRDYVLHDLKFRHGHAPASRDARASPCAAAASAA